MTEPRKPGFNRNTLIRSYFINLIVLLVPTLLLLNTPYGSIVLAIYFIVFVIGLTSYLRTDLEERSRGLAGLLGCGTTLLLLIPYVIIMYIGSVG